MCRPEAASAPYIIYYIIIYRSTAVNREVGDNIFIKYIHTYYVYNTHSTH